ncbi:P450-derived glycosyltransferase activator [Micromonospora arborensis]|uniref:P450-derived glycosyltransferase activator n=1 Tax=Micromonospora arborensis TaxID=2116518 RepID=A0A318NEG4_9ACTN|nr:P450-derived glycosyltransferase activator [Micromonospora arborensis]PYC63458.1 P450-derived glycosyltransferase activator [Micromonospora arborensis]
MTKHQIDPRQVTESDLARHLLAARGIQWMRGNRGDPYALILRSQGIDPHRLFPALRGAPALRQSEPDVWVTADHATGAAALAHPSLVMRDAAAERRRKRVFSIDSRTSLKYVLSVDGGLLSAERADRARLAAVAAPLIGPDVVRAHLDAAGAAFAAALPAAGPFDLMTSFARPVTLTVLADLLGVPGDRRDEFAAACATAGYALDAHLCPPTLDMTRRLVASYDALHALLSELVKERAAEPADAVAAHLLIAVAGAEVVPNLICSAVLSLLAHPEQWRALCADPGRAEAAVEETLRFEPPIRIESRIAAAPVELGGQAVPKGDQVVVLVDGANRDPSVFTDPDRFDITRPPAGHLSTSPGTNAGFVAAPAGLLAAEALRRLAAAAPGLRQGGDVVRRMRSPVVRSIARCPVEF